MTTATTRRRSSPERPGCVMRSYALQSDYARIEDKRRARVHAFRWWASVAKNAILAASVTWLLGQALIHLFR